MERRKFISDIGKGLSCSLLLPGLAVSDPVEKIFAILPGSMEGKDMKKALLIGDSIRMGYQSTVKDILNGKVEIIWPVENCTHSGKILQNLDNWILSPKPDLVHMNAGLHEIYRNDKTGLRQISIEKYTSNLELIFTAIRSAGIKLIWSNTTPVIDEWYHRERGYVARLNADVISYNEAASSILKKYRIPSLNLYSFCDKRRNNHFFSKDGVHFTSQGSLELGKLVAKFIKKHL
jgi:lysophospholipase L1-like esterase